MMTTSKLNKYDTYKDSGIEWIGEIPQDWCVGNLKRLTNFIKNGTSATQVDNETEYKVSRIETISSGIIDYSKVGHVEFFNGIEDYKLKKYDILFSNINSLEMVGNIAIYNNEIPLYSGMNLLRISANKETYPKWLYYVLKNSYFSELVKASAKHAINQVSIGVGKLSQIPIIIPNYNEQQQISDYLDKKCRKIDRVVETQKDIIEKLKEYKQSVITEAVTKGLDKSTPLKDSGIEWIGKIPEHWNVINSRRMFKERKDKLFNGDIQLTASQKYGIIEQEKFMKLEQQRVTVVLKGSDILKHVEPNDFVISMRSFQGGLELSEIRGCISSAYVMLIPDNKIYPRFYKWVFKSITYIQALQSTSNLIRDGQAMRFTNFVQVPIMILGIEEQQEIADYLDKKCTEIDNAIKDKEQLIEKLTEYKKSLIYECVTGKRKVVL